MATIKCANCGGVGHVYRTCALPITSYGIICFRMHEGRLQYLMIQRRHSLSYVEFLRGKYQHENKGYVLKLFNNMTAHERRNLDTMTFDELWADLWNSDHGRCYQREYADARAKFERLSKGYLIRDEAGNLHFMSIPSVIEITKADYDETEWGFPKGRRNINENDFGCAIREFREETGIPNKCVFVMRNIKPVEEIFLGINKVRYRHVYFVATFTPGVENHVVCVDPSNATQVREVRAVGWFDYEEVLQHIRPQNVERKEVFMKVHEVVCELCSTPVDDSAITTPIWRQHPFFVSPSTNTGGGKKIHDEQRMDGGQRPSRKV
jgi:8-oxo-dGTP pyrophosphatase MutT (NUDIX family)